MNKKNILFTLIGIIVIGVIYFGYKGFNLYYYNINNIASDNYENFSDGLKITDTISIKTEKLDENQYLTFKNIKIKNDFVDFKKLDNQHSEDSLQYYVMYNENGKVQASFWIGETDTYINLLKNEVTLFGIGDNRITNLDLNEFLDKNDINNDIDLFKYLEKNKLTKNNIFTSVKKIKENYIIYFMSFVMLPSLENITLLDGDYTGYILNSTSGVKEVSILKNDKRYVFTFMKSDYFTDEYINELLNTVDIDV